MTDEQFCAIHSAFTGEKTTSIQQIVLDSFSGEELKEFVEFCIKQSKSNENEFDELLEHNDCHNCGDPLYPNSVSGYCNKCI